MTDTDFELTVREHYTLLYRFALSLTRSEAEACDLTQESFYILAKKSAQIRDASKTKAWLYTTLRRLFLKKRRHVTRFPHHELSTVEDELPTITPNAINTMDSELVREAMNEVDERYREALTLFYFRSASYKEIADVLEIPAGTVMSRLARGKEQIRTILAKKLKVHPAGNEDNIIQVNAQ